MFSKSVKNIDIYMCELGEIVRNPGSGINSRNRMSSFMYNIYSYFQRDDKGTTQNLLRKSRKII